MNSSPEGFQCTCLPSFFGSLCEIRDPCFNNDACGDNGKCVATASDTTSCICNEGFTGTQCEMPIANPCEPNPCMNEGKCVPMGETFVCECEAFYSGPTCSEKLANPCDTNPCKFEKKTLPFGFLFFKFCFLFLFCFVSVHNNQVKMAPNVW